MSLYYVLYKTREHYDILVLPLNCLGHKKAMRTKVTVFQSIYYLKAFSIQIISTETEVILFPRSFWIFILKVKYPVSTQNLII